MVRAYHGDKNSAYDSVLIKPKEGRSAITQGKHPIVSKMILHEVAHPTRPHEKKKKYTFVEWVVVRKV